MRYNRYDPPDSYYDPPEECDDCRMYDQDVKFLRDEVEDMAREIETMERELRLLRAGAEISLDLARGVSAVLEVSTSEVTTKYAQTTWALETVADALATYDNAMAQLLIEEES